MTFDIKYNSVNKDLIEMLTLIVLDCVYIYICIRLLYAIETTQTNA